MTPIPTNKGLLIPVVVPVDTPLFLNEAWKRDVHNLNLWMALILKSHYSVEGIMKMKPAFVGTIMYKDGECIFDFDPEPFVQSVLSPGDPPVYYADYSSFDPSKDPPHVEFVQTAKDSLLTRLQSMGHYWVNPLGEEPNINDYTINNHAGTQTFRVSKYTDAKEAWQEAESRKLSVDQMVVLIQVK